MNFASVERSHAPFSTALRFISPFRPAPDALISLALDAVNARLPGGLRGSDRIVADLGCGRVSARASPGAVPLCACSGCPLTWQTPAHMRCRCCSQSPDLPRGLRDGRVLIAAAQRFGVRGWGVDLDEKLITQASVAAERAGKS